MSDKQKTYKWIIRHKKRSSGALKIYTALLQDFVVITSKATKGFLAPWAFPPTTPYKLQSKLLKTTQNTLATEQHHPGNQPETHLHFLQ